ncbi:MFS general substrate transporter [Canariomyces notabilis]|uniref:MFS general substrate transporter n=1 Tax=Canariomyces notabilis TaxID=2074819 RepID=A0AAN6YQH5_9PEZI|nr:MFS general substrate transporter [Canariomyces arenarius]
MNSTEYPEPKAPFPGSEISSDTEHTVVPAEPPSSSQPLAGPHSHGNFPEGGAQAWLTVSGASACLFVSFGWVNCAGIFQQHYQANQLSAYTPSEVAWIPALQVFFMLFAGCMVGKIFDDYGPSVLLAAGTFLHVFGLMMTSLSTEYYQILLSQAICSALGASMVFFPAFNCASTWFLKKRGAAMGLVAMGSSIGGIIFPVMLIHLIPRVGFAWAIRTCAFLILALLIWANLTVRSRIPPSKRPFRIKAFISPLREVPFVLLTAAVFIFYWGMFVPFTYIVVEARARGMSPDLANYLVVILNAASIVGRTVPNALADRFGHFNMMIAMATLVSVLVLAVWIPASGDAAAIAFSVLFGIASGAGIGLIPVLIAQVSPIQEIGTRTGTYFAIASLAALSGSPIGGAILGSASGASGFRNTKIFSGVTCAVGALLFVATNVALGGWKRAKSAKS